MATSDLFLEAARLAAAWSHAPRKASSCAAGISAARRMDNRQDDPTLHPSKPMSVAPGPAPRLPAAQRSEEHTSELQSHSDLHSFPTRRSSDLQRRQEDGQ